MREEIAFNLIIFILRLFAYAQRRDGRPFCQEIGHAGI